jgi:hypothetical protein
MMIDAEVVRLRKLRDVAFRARALAKVLDSDPTIDNSVFARSAVICWRVARIATGRLRAHPYLSYQRGPSQRRALADRLIAEVVAFIARGRNRRLNVLAEQLQCVAREVNDVRALTWSQELSDALGRTQLQVHRLAAEFDIDVQSERRRVAPIARTDAKGAAPQDVEVENSWPYLAI